MKKLLTVLSLIFLYSCGFKIVNLSNFENYNILEIKTSGNNKVNYIIKNNFPKTQKNNNKKDIIISLQTKKNKDIKERNLKNEITKYEITIISNIEIIDINKNQIINFSKSVGGAYEISKQNLTSKSAEKELVEILSNQLAQEIIKEASLKLNDI